MAKEQVDDKLNIYQRMHAMMTDVSYVAKENKRVNGQYTFVSHDAVTRVVREAAVKHRVVIIPSVTERFQDGNRTDVTVSIKFVNIDNPADFVEANFFGYGIDTQDKGPGKAVSYACKYGYLKMLGLETGDDPEKDSIEYDANAGKKAISHDTIVEITRLAALKGADINKALDYYGAGTIEMLWEDQGQTIIRQLNAK